MACDSSRVSSELLAPAVVFYSQLIRQASHAGASDPSSERDLGGLLFYAGELNEKSNAMIISANVAGCATLVATADPNAQKQAIRDGVVDFVVNSLDEALRILKNEIRKRATVAVCVGITPEQAEREMIERGVVPDIVGERETRISTHSGPATRVAYSVEPPENEVLLRWRVSAAPARWMPKLDSIASECLSSDPTMRRWIRLSPRFAGRAASSHRVICCKALNAENVIQSFRQAVEGGAIAVDIDVELNRHREADSIVLSAAPTT